MPYPAHSGWLKTHDMCATRFSACRRNGFLRLKAPLRFYAQAIWGAFVLGVSVCSATALCTVAQAAPAVRSTTPPPPIPAAAQPVPATPPTGAQQQRPPNGTAVPSAATGAPTASTRTPKPLRVEEQIAQLADQLAHAKTPEEAHRLEGMLETLRAANLTPTTHLLLRRAEKDVANNKPDNAVDAMADALALQPDKAILWRSSAQMRLVAGDLNGAVKDLGSALQRDPKDSQSWSLLATVEEHRNDGPAALKAWQKVLELNPMADKNHKRLDALHIKAFGQPT
ncbi:tetratricopeptide repeat protein [Acetobacter orientalis]|uniref:tetratricopeptide repeat protein n=1 Tax=Acetobacter orientalis TaxID=146474 RepID=UPI0039EA9F18